MIRQVFGKAVIGLALLFVFSGFSCTAPPSGQSPAVPASSVPHTAANLQQGVVFAHFYAPW